MFDFGLDHVDDGVGQNGSDAGPLPIRKLSRFVALPEAPRQALAHCLAAHVRTVGRARPIVEAGDVTNDLVMMLDGWACSTRPSMEGRPLIVALHLPGDICDLTALVRPHADCSVTALSPARLALLSREALAQLTAAHPICGRALWWEAMSAASIRGQWIARLSSGSARARLADLLCELATRLRAVGLASDTGFDIPISQIDLGRSCGLTPEHTNRVLRDLRSRRIIAWERGRLEILDWTALRAESRFDPAYLNFRLVPQTPESPVAPFG